MKEGDKLLETGVGRMQNGAFIRRAASPLFSDARFKMPRGYALASDGLLWVGPFATERAAIDDLADFEQKFMRACRKQFGTTFEAAPGRDQQH